MSIREEIILKIFKIQGYKLKSITEGDDLVLNLERINESICPICSKIKPRYDSRIQKFYIGTILTQAVYASVKIYRIKCEEHKIKTEQHGISDGKKRYTEAVAKSVILHTELLDNKSTSKLLGLSASSVYRIDRERLSEMFEKYKNNIPLATRLCVDETAYRKGHKYATIISNYDSGKVLWVEKDRNKKSLIKGYKAISSIIDGIEAVSMDLWKGYELATIEAIPKAKIIYDKFHLSRILNRYIEEQRREYQKTLPDEDRKEVKKNYRWVLLKRKKNHSKANKLDLEYLKIKNEKLYELYLLKESFLKIFDSSYKTKQRAKRMILNWVDTVNKTSLNSLKNFARITIKRIDKMLNWFDYPISNGKAEGVNNTIKTLFKRSYGYKDFEYLKIKILQKSGELMRYV